VNPRPFTWTAGLVLLLIGIAGFVPPLAPLETSPLRIAAGVGGRQLFGLFPVSPLVNVIHLGLGAWGVFAGRQIGRAVIFARWAATLLGLLTLMGMVPGADELFGGGPLYGNNLLLHGSLALLAFLFGWLYRHAAPPAAEEPQAANASSATARSDPAPNVAAAARPAASGTTTSRK
jgi:Domain of unknown function (DUF4383)